MTEALNRTLEDLAPSSRYVVRVRAINGLGVTSDWSEALDFDTLGDDSVPGPVENATTDFSGFSLLVDWDPPTENEDGSAFYDLGKYIVSISDGSTSVDYETTNSHFVYTLEQHRRDFDPLAPELDVSITVVDLAGNQSESVDLVAVNVPPSKPLTPEVNVGGRSVSVVMRPAAADSDIVSFELEVSTDGESSWDPLYSDAGSLFIDSVSEDFGDRSYRYKVVDVFGQESTWSDAASVTVMSGEDSTPPADVTGFAVDENDLDASGNPYVRLIWNPNNTDSDLAQFTIRYENVSTGLVRSVIAGPGDSDYVLSDLDEGTDYNFTIKAVDYTGNASSITGPISATTQVDNQPLDAPDNVSSNSGFRSITLRWDTVSGNLDFYRIYVSETAGVTTSDTVLHEGNSNVFVHEFDENGPYTRYYAVTAIGENGTESSLSTEVSDDTLTGLTTDDDPPSTVVNLDGQSDTYYHGSAEKAYVDLSWDAASDNVGVTAYIVGYRVTAGTWTELISSGDATNYRVTDLVPGTTYEFRVKAMDAAGNRSSSWSNQIQRTPTTDDGEAVDTPSNLSTASPSPGTLRIDWDVVDNVPVRKYLVQVDENNSFSSPRNFYADATEITVNGAVGVTYYVRVKAVDEFGNESAWSATESLEVKTVDTGDLGTVDLGDSAFVGQLAAGRIIVGSASQFDSDYDPTEKETPAGAQSKADAAQSAAESYADTVGSDANTYAENEAANALSQANSYTDGAVDGLITTYYQSAQPSGANQGDLWVDTDTDRLYRYNGAGWDPVQDQDIAQALADAATAQSTADGKIDSYYETTEPSGLTATDVGDLWFDTDDDNHPYRWSGSAWQSIRDATIAAAQSDAAQALVDASDAQATADGKVTTFVQGSTPTAEGIGDLWIDSSDDNKLYRWNGSTWVLIRDDGIVDALTDASNAQATADSKIVTFYEDNEPTGETVGDLWVDTNDNNKIYRFNGSTWDSVRDGYIDIAASNAQSNAESYADANKRNVFSQSTQPTANDVGDLWIDSDDNKLYRWNGSTWINIQDNDIAQALADASTAQATADGKVTTFYQDNEPTAEGDGDLWVDTNDGNRLYRWDSGVPDWVEIQDQEIQQAISDASTAQATADSKILSFYQATQPTAEGEGDIWYDTNDDNHPYIWTGSNWLSVQDGTISVAQQSADGKNVIFQQSAKPVAGDLPSPGRTSLQAGDVWIDTDDGNRFYVYVEGGTNDFVDAQDGAIAVAQSSADGRNMVFYKSSTPTTGDLPTDGRQVFIDGDTWYDTDDQNHPYVHTGGDSGTFNPTSVRDGAIQVANESGNRVYSQDSKPTGGTYEAGDLWIDTNDSNKLYVYVEGATNDFVSARDGTITVAQQAADSKTFTFYKATAPVVGDLPANGRQVFVEGDLWVDIDDDNHPYIHSGADSATFSETSIRDGYIDSAATSALSQANTYTDGEVDGLVTTYYEANEPPSANQGDLWIDTDDGSLSVYDLGSWTPVQDSDIAQALSDAATAQSTADGKINSYFQNDAPTGLGPTDVGDLWFELDDENKPWRWDGDSWEPIRDEYIDTAADQAKADAISQASTYTDDAVDGLITTYYSVSGSPPSSPQEGDLWFQTDVKKLKRYDSSVPEWVLIEDQGITDALDSAQNAQDTADGKIQSFYDTSEPADNPANDLGEGDLWFDQSNDDEPHRWSGAAWVSIRDTAYTSFIHPDVTTDLNILSGEIQTLEDNQFSTYVGTTEPTGAVEGDLWIDEGNNSSLKRFDGDSWGPVDNENIASALSTATSAANVADAKVQVFVQNDEPVVGDLPPDVTAFDYGDLWFDTLNDNEPHYWDGDSWESARDGAIDTLNTAITGINNDISNINDELITTYFSPTAPSGVEYDLWYDTENELLYRHSGAGWGAPITDTTGIGAAYEAAAGAQETADGKVQAYYQVSEPSGLSAGDVGDLWFDTDDSNKAYHWDGDSWEVIQSAEITTLNNSIGTINQTLEDDLITTYFLEDLSPPSSPELNDLWYKIDLETLHRYNGSIWVAITDETGVGAAYEAAKDAEEVADGKVQSYYATDEPSGLGAGDVGDLWFDTDDGNRAYHWDGDSWELVQAAEIGVLNTSISDINQTLTDNLITTYFLPDSSPPSSPELNDLWYKTDLKTLHRYEGDPADWSTAITDETGIGAAYEAAKDAEELADRKIQSFYEDGPAGPANDQNNNLDSGDLWFDTDDDNKPYRWDGDLATPSWVSLRDGTIAIAQQTADSKIKTYEPIEVQDSNDEVSETLDDLEDNTTYVDDSSPQGETEGDLWFLKGAVDQTYRWDGSAWGLVRDSQPLINTYVDRLDAAIRGDYGDVRDTTQIDGGSIYTGTVDADVLVSDIAITNGLHVESVFQINPAGVIQTQGFDLGNKEGMRLTVDSLEIYGSGGDDDVSLIIGGDNGLNFNQATGQLWFGDDVFANADFAVDSDKDGVQDTVIRIGDSAGNPVYINGTDGSLYGGASDKDGTGASWTLNGDGSATLKNVVINPTGVMSGDDLVINTGNFQVQADGDVIADNITANGGTIGATTINATYLEGGEIRGTTFKIANSGGIVFDGSGTISWDAAGSGGIELSDNGYIKNSTWDGVNGENGFRIDETGVFINEGTITANALQIGIGGTNLLTNSAFENNDGTIADGWTAFDGSTTIVSDSRFLSSAQQVNITDNTSAGILQEVAPVGNFINGTRYALSAWIKCTSGSVDVKLQFKNSATLKYETTTQTISSGDGWTRVTGVWESTVSFIDMDFRILIEGSNSDVAIIDGAKVEQSDFATDWSPAPLEIPDGYIQSAYISGLTADKINSGTISAETITIGSTGFIQSNDWDGSTGWRLDTTGVTLYNNAINIITDVNGGSYVSLDGDGLQMISATNGTVFNLDNTGMYLGGYDSSTARFYYDDATGDIVFKSDPALSAHSLIIDADGATDDKIIRLTDGVEDVFWLKSDGTGSFSQFTGNAGFSLDNAGLQLFDTGGTRTVFLDASDGSAEFTGTITAQSGTIEGDLNVNANLILDDPQGGSKDIYIGDSIYAGGSTYSGINLDYSETGTVSNFWARKNDGRILFRVGEKASSGPYIEYDSQSGGTLTVEGDITATSGTIEDMTITGTLDVESTDGGDTYRTILSADSEIQFEYNSSIEAGIQTYHFSSGDTGIRLYGSGDTIYPNGVGVPANRGELRVSDSGTSMEYAVYSGAYVGAGQISVYNGGASIAAGTGGTVNITGTYLDISSNTEVSGKFLVTEDDGISIVNTGHAQIQFDGDSNWKYWLHANGDMLYVLSNQGDGGKSATGWHAPYPITIDGSLARVQFGWYPSSERYYGSESNDYIQFDGSTEQIRMYLQDAQEFVLGQTGLNIPNVYSYDSVYGSYRAVYANSDGNIGTTGSSRRYKKNIEYIEPEETGILTISPATFDKKFGTRKNGIELMEWAPQRFTGFIAEEIGAVAPEAVVYEDGEVIDYDDRALVALMFNEVKRLDSRVKELESRFKNREKK